MKLDKPSDWLKNTPHSVRNSPLIAGFRMNSIRPTHSSPESPNANHQPVPPVCRHPRVQIVSRDEDSEFVECLDCREIFDSSEFKDMDIEERNGPEL